MYFCLENLVMISEFYFIVTVAREIYDIIEIPTENEQNELISIILSIKFIFTFYYCVTFLFWNIDERAEIKIGACI